MLKAKHDRHQKANNPSTGKKEERDASVDWQAAQNESTPEVQHFPL